MHISQGPIPSDIKELFDMMKEIPNLCGEFYITENGNIEWNLYDPYKVEIYIEEDECCLDIAGLMHWHPTLFELYDEIASLGKKGNVLVIRTFLTSAILLYEGNQEDCPYNEDSKVLLGKLHYLEAK